MNNTDKNSLLESLDALNDYIASQEYADLKMNPNTPIEVKRTLVALIHERNKLTETVLKIIAAELDSNNDKFKDLVDAMNELTKSAKEAQEHLEEIADKIEMASQVAKLADQAMKLAAGLMK